MAKLMLCHGPLIRCSTASSRLAAYEVLVMLADSSLSNLRLITKELLSMHHQPDPSLCKEFDVRPSRLSFFVTVFISFYEHVAVISDLCSPAAVSPPRREPLSLRVRGAQEWRSHLLHERRVSAALHATWPPGGTSCAVQLPAAVTRGHTSPDSCQCPDMEFMLWVFLRLSCPSRTTLISRRRASSIRCSRCLVI